MTFNRTIRDFIMIRDMCSKISPTRSCKYKPINKDLYFSSEKSDSFIGKIFHKEYVIITYKKHMIYRNRFIMHIDSNIKNMIKKEIENMKLFITNATLDGIHSKYYSFMEREAIRHKMKKEKKYNNDITTRR